MRVLGTTVQPLVRSMLDSGHDLPPCRAIGTKLIGDNALRQASQLLQQPDQQASGRLGVAAVLDDLIKYVSMAASPQPAGIVRAELLRPATDRLIGNDDAAFQ